MNIDSQPASAEHGEERTSTEQGNTNNRPSFVTHPEDDNDVNDEQYSENSDAASVVDVDCTGILGYAVGHFYNDLCASMWFTYLMIFLERVMHFKTSAAGFLMLVGQVTDAISTPIVGIASDSSRLPSFLKSFGRRISWHLIGTVCVTLSFPFIFNKPLLNANVADIWQISWYLPFIMLFQFGWASVQISHLALIPELSADSGRRNALGSLRYSFTVLANLFVFGGLSALLHLDDRGGGVTSSDLIYFNISSFLVVGVGVVTSLLFYLTTKEPTDTRTLSRLNSVSSTASELVKMSWRKWFCHLQFYQVSLLYMLSRLYINISQVYFPFYITMTANLSKKYIALLPMISYISSFVLSTIISTPAVNRFFGNKVLYFFGCLLGLVSCVIMYLDKAMVSVLCASIFIGLAQAIVLVSVLAITADLINENTESGAFVYGVMSFLDKLANGVAYQIIELVNPGCNASDIPENCSYFYRGIMSFVPGGCLILSFLVLIPLYKENIGVRPRGAMVPTVTEPNDDEEAPLTANDILAAVQRESAEADSSAMNGPSDH